MRHEGDTWDIVSSVGRTALAVATFRALETERPDALVRDDFARWFVEAADDPLFTGLLTDPTPLERLPMFFAGSMGLRTRFFDDFFTEAAADGLTQAVIVAAGLDDRAYRLPWPPDAVVFEIDQPSVLEFKSEVLTDHAVEPGADRRPVAVDLREDWPGALVGAGFDPDRPSAWSAEGLLAYLPGAAHDALFARIDGLSVAGSRLALNAFGTDTDAFAALRNKYLTGTPFGEMDPTELFYDDARVGPARWLGERAWTVTEADTEALAARYGLPMPALPQDVLALHRSAVYLTATKGSNSDADAHQSGSVR